MAVVSEKGIGNAESSTLHFIVAWARERSGDRRHRAATALTPPEVAVVVRQAACLLGDRPLQGVTLGDLARLPALLERGGMEPASARAACREIGRALRAAMGGWGARHDAARTATGGSR